MTRRDRAQANALLNDKGVANLTAFEQRLLLELDRIGSALETIVSLMDDHDYTTPIDLHGPDTKEGLPS